MAPSTRTVLGAVLVVLVAVAGGVVALGGLDGPDSSSYLTARQTSDGAPANETVAFSELSPAQQRVFEEAAGTDGTVEIPDGVDRTVWIENSYVTYRNDTYWAAVAVPG